MHCPILQALPIVHVEVQDSADGMDAVVMMTPEAIYLCPTLVVLSMLSQIGDIDVKEISGQCMLSHFRANDVN